MDSDVRGNVYVSRAVSLVKHTNRLHHYGGAFAYPNVALGGSVIGGADVEGDTFCQ